MTTLSQGPNNYKQATMTLTRTDTERFTRSTPALLAIAPARTRIVTPGVPVAFSSSQVPPRTRHSGSVVATLSSLFLLALFSTPCSHPPCPALRATA